MSETSGVETYFFTIKINMSNRPANRPGGLLLRRADLQPILDEPDTIGIAFALKEVGKAENVSLQVVKVAVKDGRYTGEARAIPPAHKKGVAGALHYPASDVDEYQFHFLPKLEEDGYFFGYFNNFEGLFKGRDGWDEIFIGGGKQSYAPGMYDQDDWFTFTIAIRRGLKEVELPIGKMTEAVAVAQRALKLPLLKKSGFVSALEIAAEGAELGDIPGKTVDTIFKDSGWLTGVGFTDGTALLLDENMRARTVQLDADYHLEAIHLEEGKPGLDESFYLGSNLPFALHTIGCPPQWPDEGTDGDGAKENVRLAVEEARRGRA